MQALQHQSAMPTLHLSGPRLRAALESLIAAAEGVGGIERLVQAVALRGEILRDRIGSEGQIDRAGLDEIMPLLPTVRRRVGVLIATCGSARLHAAIAELLGSGGATVDERVAAFERALAYREKPPANGGGSGSIPLLGARGDCLAHAPSTDRAARFVRDLAAELLHAVDPEKVPLMTRWVWDAASGTGVLREIWHDPSGLDVDRAVIDIDDRHATFLALRAELSQFLSDNGIFRDMLAYVDALQAHIYGTYIEAQGGALLKTDFASGSGDPLGYTRRMLGLDSRPMSLRRVIGGGR